jgi:hypothetical protein
MSRSVVFHFAGRGAPILRSDFVGPLKTIVDIQEVVWLSTTICNDL